MAGIPTTTENTKTIEEVLDSTPEEVKEFIKMMASNNDSTYYAMYSKIKNPNISLDLFNNDADYSEVARAARLISKADAKWMKEHTEEVELLGDYYYGEETLPDSGSSVSPGGNIQQ